MMGRSSMGKQLTGNRTKKMAKGGSASKGSAGASKSSASKGDSKPAAKSGGSAAGKTINTSSTRSNAGGGGGGMFSGIHNAVSSALSGGKKMTSVTDPKTGQTYAKPTYGAMSLKGLTSSDPANVARNRAAAAKYAALEAARRKENNYRNEDNPGGLASVVNPTVAVSPTAPTAPVAPKMVYTPPPVGYRPGVDPEHKFYQPAPTVTMAKGGRVKPKRVK